MTQVIGIFIAAYTLNELFFLCPGNTGDDAGNTSAFQACYDALHIH